MAKKSLIAGEYIIEIADNGHVDVMRVFRNAKVTMESIAKSKDFPVEVKWNTRTLGRHLVQEFGDGKTAQFDDITVNRFPNGQIEIYQKCKNVIDALRTIAKQLGFAYEDTWNTQTFGSKLSDYLIEHKEEADKILQTKNARRKNENANADTEESIARNDMQEESITADDEVHTYHVFVSGRVLRMDTVQMENANDDDVENGFANEEEWTETVKATLNLYTQKEDLIENPDSFADESVEKLTDMLGEGYVDCGSCMIDTSSDFTITVKDDEENEICTIDAEDVPQIVFEQGYETYVDDLDEDDEDDMEKKALIEENPRFGNADILNLCLNPDAWYWINVQEADTDEPIEFVINAKGEFDKDKMRFVRVLAEEWSHGLKSVEGIVALVYDQEEADMYDNGTLNEEATNIFVKTDEDDELHTVRVFDFTNWEEDK